MCFRCTACASNSYKTSNPEKVAPDLVRGHFTQVLPNPWHGVRIVNAQNILPMPPAMPGICFECSLLFCWNIIFFFVCHVGMLGWVLRFLQGWSWLLARFSTNCEQHGPTKKLILARILPKQPNAQIESRDKGTEDVSHTFSPLSYQPTSRKWKPKKSGKHPSLRIPQKCEFEFHRWHRADCGNKTCG